MYELIKVSQDSYYIQCPAKIGIFKISESEVCLIDSGNDKNAGKKVKKILDAQGWTLRMILNTHSHADHIGGNNYLAKETGCKIYAGGIERDFTRHPILEGISLYGGYTPNDLRHKFILAEESDAEELTSDILPQGIEMIGLPGHSFDMAGFKTASGTVFLGDCLSSREILEKYKIGYIYDVKSYLSTLEKVGMMEGEIFIPSHTEPTDDIRELVRYNIDTVNSIGDKICILCQTPKSFETILKELFDEYGLKMNFEQYALVGSTVRSYLAWLKDEGRITVNFEGNKLLWASL